MVVLPHEKADSGVGEGVAGAWVRELLHLSTQIKCRPHPKRNSKDRLVPGLRETCVREGEQALLFVDWTSPQFGLLDTLASAQFLIPNPSPGCLVLFGPWSLHLMARARVDSKGTWEEE